MSTTFTKGTKAIYKGRSIVKTPKGFKILPTSGYQTKTVYPTLLAATAALDRWKH